MVSFLFSLNFLTLERKYIAPFISNFRVVPFVRAIEHIKGYENVITWEEEILVLNVQSLSDKLQTLIILVKHIDWRLWVETGLCDVFSFCQNYLPKIQCICSLDRQDIHAAKNHIFDIYIYIQVLFLYIRTGGVLISLDQKKIVDWKWSTKKKNTPQLLCLEKHGQEDPPLLK